MKAFIKVFTVIIICTLAFSSCKKAEMVNNSETQPHTESEALYTEPETAVTDVTTAVDKQTTEMLAEPPLMTASETLPKQQTTEAVVAVPQTTQAPVTQRPVAQPTTSKPVPPSSNGSQAYQREMLVLINNERRVYGIGELSLNESVCNSAQIRAQEIASDYPDSFSHNRPNGDECFSAITINYNWAGENIAMGYPDVSTVMNGWMNSPGHRSNILKAEFTHVGIGCFEKDGHLYWVQMFVGLN